MNKYLEKVAKEYFNEVRVEDDDTGRKWGAALVGGVTAGYANKKVNGWTTKGFLSSLKNSASTPGKVESHVVDNILDDVLPRTNSTINPFEVGGNFHAATALGGRSALTGPYYMSKETLPYAAQAIHAAGTVGQKVKNLLPFTGAIPDYTGQMSKANLTPFTKNYVGVGMEGALGSLGKLVPGLGNLLGGAAPSNRDSMLPVLGKAVDMNTGWAKTKRLSTGLSEGLMKYPAAGIGGAMLASDKTKDYAWAVPAVAAIPSLRSEIVANKNAYDLIKQHGGDANKYLGTALKNVGRKALVPSVAGATLAGINYLRSKGEEVNPDEWIKER